MDRVARCRHAARDAVADVSPPRLRRRLVDEIDAHTMTPAVLTLESGFAADPNADADTLSSLAAGTQLIYNGLQLTRELAHEEPWEDTDERATGGGIDADGDTAAETPEPGDGEADLAIVAADVLVARGFSLLAETDAAETAVATIRAFGRDQTSRRQPGADAEAIDARLERDVLDLAVQTGAAGVDRSPEPAMVDLADALADRADASFPPAEGWLDTTDVTTADGLASDGGAADSSHWED